MVMPFGLYYSDLENIGSSELAELARLLGVEPGVGLDGVRRAMASVNRLWSRRCLRLGVGKDCVVSYKYSLEPRDYLRRPILAAARGAVVRHYRGGGVRQLAMPFAKFFNYRECRECSRIPSNRFIATEKLDGTLIVAYRDPDTGELLLSTRGSLHRPPVARNPYAERFLASVERLGLRWELESIVREKTTVMFELVNTACPASRCLGRELEAPPGDSRWRVFLIAARSHDTMEISYESPGSAFPRPRRIEAENFRELVGIANSLAGEGLVVLFPGETYLGFPWWNYMLKMKNKQYVFRSLLGAAEIDEATRRSMYRRIARLVASGRIDDVAPLLEGTEFVDFATRYREEYRRLVEAYTALAEKLRALVARHGAEKTRNYLRHNLAMKSLADDMELILENPEAAASRTVREKLLAKGGPEALLNALKRHRRRIETIINEIRSLAS